MTEKEKILAAHLAAMCCQADEDCPAEYRTEHFRSTMDDAYDYLKEIGYLNEQKTRASNGPSIPAACALVRGPGPELQATSHKLQASGCKLDKIKL